MKAVDDDADWDLMNPRDTGDGPANTVFGTVKARDLWNEITESAWKTGDPGVVFVDRVWETAPNPQMGKIKTSNPCGEEFLENYGNCCLGSINLDLHIAGNDFDWKTLEQTTRTAVRFLNDVIEVNSFPLSKLRDVNLETRRIGLGVMGWADSLVRMGIPYDSEEAIAVADRLGSFLNTTAWDESAKVAEERGPFSQYEQSALKEWGMPPVRNSSVITIAPTGTISLSIGNNVSNGIEPSFAHHYFRNVIREQKKTKEKVDVYSFELLSYIDKINPNADIEAEPGTENALPDYFITAEDILPRQHVDVQGASQKWIDSSISKTANVPTEFEFEEFKDIYLYAHEKGLKGCTTFRFNPEAFQGVLVKEKDLENTMYTFVLDDGEEIEVAGNEEIEYDGETHTAANLFDALKEGYYGKF